MPITDSTTTNTTRGTSYTPAHMTSQTPAEDFRTVLLNRVSWGAVSAGVAVSLVVHLILNLLGIGIGVIANPVVETADSTGISIAAMAWWAVAGILSAFCGGYTAGRLAGEPSESTAGWHGITAWAVSIVVITVLMTTAAGVLVGGNFTFMTDMTRDDVVISTDAAPGAAYDPIYGAGNATTVTEDEAEAIGTAALFSSLALLLGALVAWLGGRMGAVSPVITDREAHRMPLH